MANEPEARVVHAMPGRIRLRIAAMKGDEEYFSTLQEKLVECAGVESVEVNPVSASVLLYHQGDMTPLQRLGAEVGLFSVAPGKSRMKPVAMARAVGREYRQLDTGLQRVSNGQLDIATLTAVGLIGAGLFQVLRGNLQKPAWYTLLWYGANAMLKAVAPAAEEPRAGGVVTEE